MKRVMHWLVPFLFFFVLMIGALTFFVIRYPQYYFQSEWAVALLKKENFSKSWTWTDLDFDLKSPNFLVFDLIVSAKNLNADYQLDGDYLELKDADLSAVCRIYFKLFEDGKLWDWSVEALQPLRLSAASFSFNLALDSKDPSFDQADQEKALLWKKIPSEILNPLFRGAQLKIAQVELAHESETYLSLQSFSLEYGNEDNLELLTQVSSSISKINQPIDIKLTLNKKELSVVANLSHSSYPYLENAHCEFHASQLEVAQESSPLKLNCRANVKSPELYRHKRFKTPMELEFSTRLSSDLAHPTFNETHIHIFSPSVKKWIFNIYLDRKEEILLDAKDSPNWWIPFLAFAHAELAIPDLSAFLNRLPEGIRELPVPLNAMNGPVLLKLRPSGTDATKDSLKLEALLTVELQGEGQQLFFEALADKKISLSSADFKGGPLNIFLNVKKMKLKLPRLSLREPVPRLFHDKRIHKSSARKEIAKSKSPFEWTINLKNEDPIFIKTSLWDMNFKFMTNLKLGPTGVQKGYVRLLPFKNEILRRPIEVKSLQIRWPPKSLPHLEGRVEFPLPEYRIRLDVEGLLKDPQVVLTSTPPLSHDDIYSVLLFGRPMNGLDAEGRMGMDRVKNSLTQGLLSLSTLYLLAGTRVESIGYDVAESEISAQFSLDKNYSLRVGTQIDRSGANSLALRRALGKGWFIESKAQDAGSAAEAQDTNFGLMLERVIAY